MSGSDLRAGRFFSTTTFFNRPSACRWLFFHPRPAAKRTDRAATVAVARFSSDSISSYGKRDTTVPRLVNFRV
jgi:hypothetical protein